MSRADKSPLTGLPPSEMRAGQRPQFSLATLLLVTLVIAIGCGAVRWLGSVWVVSVILAGSSAASLVLAIRHRSDWKKLKVGYWHLAAWLGGAALASGLAIHCCLDYNVVAGTDKTPAHIVQISATVLAGPMVGPVANPGAGEYRQAWTWTAILLTVQLVAIGPFLIVRRSVPWPIALICWGAFLAATLLWFFGAMVSLAVFLS